MDIEKFKLATQDELEVYGETLPFGSKCSVDIKVWSYKELNKTWRVNIYDNNGNKLTSKDSTGYWYESTYNSLNKELTYKNFNNYWHKSTYDELGNQLTYKDSNGFDGIAIAYGEYTLLYDATNKKYKAGCKTATYEQSLNFCEFLKTKYKDSDKFIKIIKEHHKNLGIV